MRKDKFGAVGKKKHCQHRIECKSSLAADQNQDPISSHLFLLFETRKVFSVEAVIMETSLNSENL